MPGRSAVLRKLPANETDDESSCSGLGIPAIDVAQIRAGANELTSK
jgi:hypothetical protein